eukprot:g11222.t1
MSGASASVDYDFKLLGEREGSFFLQKEMKESIRQWGMEDTLTLTQAYFSPAFKPHEETAFVRQLLSFAADKTSKPVSSLASVDSVQLEPLKCTAMSMDFFNCVVEKGVVSKSGNIRGCFPEVFEGVTVSDKLRELLVNPDSENADVFSEDQQQELLFHVFRALSVGGGVCQSDDNLEPYTVATKALYKDLVSVHKNPLSGKLEIAPCKVYRVTETFAADARAAAPDASSSPKLTCPLGFGAGRGTDGTEKRPTPSSFASAGLPRMPLAVLAAHPTLVAVKGVVFDVSGVEAYRTGLAASWAGHDASRVIAVSSGAAADVGVGDAEGLDEGLSGLRYEEHQRLEAYFLEMVRSRTAVAVLAEEDHARIFGAPLAAGNGDAKYSPATATLAPPEEARPNTRVGEHVGTDAVCQPSLLALAAELHASVEQGNAEAVARVLSLSNHRQSGGDAREGGVGDQARTKPSQQRRGSTLPHFVDCACPRTGLTPLLKAVEGGSEEMVRILLEAGGSVQSQAVLYDGDDALALAKRLGCSDSIVEMIQIASNQR